MKHVWQSGNAWGWPEMYTVRTVTCKLEECPTDVRISVLAESEALQAREAVPTAAKCQMQSS